MTLQAAAQDVAMVHLGDVRRMQEEQGEPSWEHWGHNRTDREDSLCSGFVKHAELTEFLEDLMWFFQNL